jgi:DNA polymerase I-like protein with 3'-5' exonuclease and polymerase domains
MNLVIDLETTIRCPVGNSSGNPMWRGNKAIAWGTELIGGSTGFKYDKKGLDLAPLRSLCDAASLVIGQNVKFDLLYIYRDTNNVLPRIWDIQLAAYLLSGQRHLYASLDELTLEYVGEHALKDDKIKAYWKAGIQTEDIPEKELMDYLGWDISNTTQIFQSQWAEAEALEILPLMFTQMDALRATIEMNRHGMHVDWKYVQEQRDHYAEILIASNAVVATLEPELDTASPKQLSLYFFGGEEKYKEKVEDGLYKNGNVRTRTVEKVRTITGKYAPTGELGKGGYYSTDDAALKQLVAYGDEIAEQLLIIRECSKIKDTYYEGLIGLRFPDEKIYPNLNHCATKTGRLSATNPNLQNQTETGDVKRAYVSRYGNIGAILELDYSQLEMVALAYLANDQQLIDDINNGRDMHRELYKGMYGRYPTDKERKPFKRFSFLLVYGGGATTLMAQSGCDRATAKKFINTFYNRYTGVKKYHEEIVAKAEKEAVVSYDPIKSGPQYTYYHKSPTGRHYIFTKYPNEYKGGLSFSPTELKNWPIQGFATGDVVPMMVGILLRKLEEANLTPSVKLVMTVHDSVVLDVPIDLLKKCAILAKETLEDAPKYMKSIFNIDFPCQLGVGVDAGLNWQDKEPILLKEIK